MKKVLLVALIAITSISSWAQDYRTTTCYDKLLYDDSIKGIEIAWNSAGLATTGFALAGSPLAIIPASVMITLIGIDLAQNNKVSRLMKLIEQAEDKVDNPESESGRLLRRIVRKLNRKLDRPISELEFAVYIDNANKDMSLCENNNFKYIRKIKKEIKEANGLE